MKKILLFFILICSLSYAQDKYYWNDVEITIQKLFDKLGQPKGTEYQYDSGDYWLAYDFGSQATIYVIRGGFVWNVIYMKTSKDINSIKQKLIEITEISIKDNFISIAKKGELFRRYNSSKQIEIIGAITSINDEYTLTIVSKKNKMGK